MRPSFVHFPVNSFFDDPIVYVNFIYEKRAILFDLGDFQTLSNRQLNRVTHVFITHMHIDHFIGFDRFLRVRLSTEEPFTLIGPPGIIDAVEGRLRGYTWNLIEEYPCSFYVLETDTKQATVCKFSSKDRFRIKELFHLQLNNGIVIQENSFIVRAALLDHAVDSLAYRLEEPVHVNVLKDKLLQRGLNIGPWLRQLKAYIRDGIFEAEIDTGNTCIKVSELLDIVKITKGQTLCYVMDASPTPENIERIIELVKDAHTLYIEAFFHSSDIQRAEERNHLTSAIAGEIAKKANVKELCPLHLSVRYKENPDLILNEIKLFSGFRTLKCQ